MRSKLLMARYGQCQFIVDKLLMFTPPRLMENNDAKAVTLRKRVSEYVLLALEVLSNVMMSFRMIEIFL